MKNAGAIAAERMNKAVLRRIFPPRPETNGPRTYPAGTRIRHRTSSARGFISPVEIDADWFDQVLVVLNSGLPEPNYYLDIEGAEEWCDRERLRMAEMGIAVIENPALLRHKNA